MYFQSMSLAILPRCASIPIIPLSGLDLSYSTRVCLPPVTGWFLRPGCYQCVTKVSQEVHVPRRILQGATVLHLAFCSIQDERMQGYHVEQVNDTSSQETEFVFVEVLRRPQSGTCSQSPHESAFAKKKKKKGGNKHHLPGQSVSLGGLMTF